MVTAGYSLGGTAPPTPKSQKLACFVSKLSTSFWKIRYASYSKLSNELKNSIKLKVGQAVQYPLKAKAIADFL